VVLGDRQGEREGGERELAISVKLREANLPKPQRERETEGGKEVRRERRGGASFIES